MSPAMDLPVLAYNNDEDDLEYYQKGVQYLCEKGITKVPKKYILPIMDRPITISAKDHDRNISLKLPVIDFAQLQSSNRIQVLNSLSKACQEYGFFQLVNHGIPSEAITKMVEVGRKFFELPFEERSKCLSKDMNSPARYGTSFNQNNDRVFCWRDFLKLNCHPLSETLPYWPSSPSQLRESAINYSEQTKSLYLVLVEAIVESLGLVDTGKKVDENCLKEFKDGSQLIVVNYYPSCPQPDLTLGLSPHSDYGFLTLLLQDELVKGLQIQHQGQWVTVEPIPNSFVANVGDHLEIFSNGRYKSILHRVLVNPSKSRISIASLHSLAFSSTIRPSPKLVEEDNAQRYKDTNFANFVEYITSCEHKSKDFLDSRKLFSS